MSRRSRKIHKKEIKPDSVYSDVMVSYFINKIMWDGKKELARGIVYGALDILSKKYPQESAVSVFKKAIDNCKPNLEVRSRRVGGATYQVPVDVRPVRRSALAIRWIITHSRTRKEKTMTDRLAEELMDAYNKKGASIKKKEDVHRMAESNRAFSHYNW
ncbi:MAG: 30S ribosomal protein S7 [Bdellovibrionales bacterium]|nr:30S ribosomal protein S7 [Bdellovibrionales bacterium]